MHRLITQIPSKFQGPFVLYRNNFDHFLEHFFIKRMLCHFKRFVAFVLNRRKLTFDNLTKFFNVLFAINNHFHEIRGVMIVVEIE